MAVSASATGLIILRSGGGAKYQKGSIRYSECAFDERKPTTPAMTQ
jgi:hypothetical protein